MPGEAVNMGSYADDRSGADVKIGSYSDRLDGCVGKDSEDSMEDNNSVNSSMDSSARQSEFSKKDHEFIPTRTSGILASKPAVNPGQFTRVNSNPLLISAQKQLLLVEEVRKKKQEITKTIGDETPEWQSELDNWKHRRRKQSEEALSRVAEYRRQEESADFGNGEKRKWSFTKKISGYLLDDDEIDLADLPSTDDSPPSPIKEISPSSPLPSSPSPQPTQSRTMGSTTTTVQHSFSTTSTHSTQLLDHDASHQHQQVDEFDEESSDEKFDEVEHQDLTDRAPSTGPRGSNPYQTAIEGYKSFAQTHLSTSERKEFRESALVHSKYPTGEGSTRITLEEQSPALDERSLAQDERSATKDIRLNEPEDLPNKVDNRSNSFDGSMPNSGKSGSPTDKTDLNKTEEEWESSIESITQPIRKPSSENISDKMRLKLANFEQSVRAEQNEGAQASRIIQSDNSFKDKLKAFKNIESSVGSGGPANNSSVGSSGLGKRRESEPQLAKPLTDFKTSRSTSSSAIQNNKFLQQDRGQETGIKSDLSSSTHTKSDAKLSTADSRAGPRRHFISGKLLDSSSGVEGADSNLRPEPAVERVDSLRSEGEESGKLLEDALEESFSILEEKNKIVFRAEDFVPSCERLAPPADKPPPLPAPPPPPQDVKEDKQEKEITENIEREEIQLNQSKKKSEGGGLSLVKEKLNSNAHKKSSKPDLTSNNHQPPQLKPIGGPAAAAGGQVLVGGGGLPASGGQVSGGDQAGMDLRNGGGDLSHSRSSSSLYSHGGYNNNKSNSVGGPVRSESTSALKQTRAGQDMLRGQEPVRRGEKDYNKHWLIQEAEQRRIAEAKQKQVEASRSAGFNKQAAPNHQQSGVNMTNSSRPPQLNKLSNQQPPDPTQNKIINQQQYVAAQNKIVSQQQHQHHQQQHHQHQQQHIHQQHIQQQQQHVVRSQHQQQHSYSKSQTNNSIAGKSRPGFGGTENYVNVTPTSVAGSGGGGGQLGYGVDQQHGGPPTGGFVGEVGGALQENIYANVDPEQQQYLNRTSSSLPPGGEMQGAPRGGPGPHLPPRSVPQVAGGGGGDRVLSVSGKKKCSACREELGRGAAMIIETLRLFYHIRCFNCCVCSVQLGNGEQGTDVRVRNNRLHCQNCYSNDEGLKFSKV